MEHLEETTLALYILEAPEVRERGAEITAHLRECAGCAQLYAEMKEYYAEVDVLRAKEDESIYPTLLASARIARSSRDPDRGPLISLTRSTAQVLVASFKTHPVRWSGSAALLILALALLVPKLWVTDRNPAYARAKDEFLIALDKNGGELWRKYVGSGFESLVSAVPGLPCVVDLDGDGKREILVMSPPVKPAVVQGIECYNADGINRWRFQFHSSRTIGSQAFSDDYALEKTIAVVDFDKNGSFKVVLAAHHLAWWPSIVELLDARNGNSLAEYWHPGWVQVAVKDVDGDGQEEILACGYNNAFQRNALAVLDPHKLGGHAPATADYTPLGIGEATEKYYVLLPAPDLFQYSSQVAINGALVFPHGDVLEVSTSRILPVDELGKRAAEVFFDFDSHMNCVKVRIGDDFASIHRRLEGVGRIKRRIDEKYLEELRAGVQYWDGEKFVKQPTINRKYVSSK